MARTAAQINADIDAVRAAIGSGVLTCSYGDRTVTYRSVVELRHALQMLDQELAQATAAIKVRSVAFMTGKGL